MSITGTTAIIIVVTIPMESSSTIAVSLGGTWDWVGGGERARAPPPPAGAGPPGGGRRELRRGLGGGAGRAEHDYNHADEYSPANRGQNKNPTNVPPRQCQMRVSNYNPLSLNK